MTQDDDVLGVRFQLSLRSDPLESDKVDLEQYVATFHDWIRSAALDGLLIDVASYAHVPSGPGVLLIGHELDFGVRVEAGRIKLTCRHKRDPRGEGHALSRCLRQLLRAAVLLQSSEHLGERPHFRVDQLVVRSNDRLACPNDGETSARISPAVARVLGQALGAESLQISSIGTAREGLTLFITRPSDLGPAEDLDTLCRRLRPTTRKLPLELRSS